MHMQMDDEDENDEYETVRARLNELAVDPNAMRQLVTARTERRLADSVSDVLRRRLRGAVASAAAAAAVRRRGGGTTDGDVARVVAQVAASSAFCRTKRHLMRLLDEAVGGAVGAPSQQEAALSWCGSVPEWVPGDVEGLAVLVAALQSPDGVGIGAVANAVWKALLAVPHFWMRRPRQETEALVALALDLLLGTCVSVQRLAALDPGATWFRNMLSSQFGRHIISLQLRRNFLGELQEFLQGLPLEFGTEVSRCAVHNILCCGFLLQSSVCRQVLQEAASNTENEDGINGLLSRITARMIRAGDAPDPVADAVRDVLVGLCCEDKCRRSCILQPGVLGVLAGSAHDDRRAIDVAVAVAQRLGRLPEPLARFVAGNDPCTTGVSLMACRAFGARLSLPKGTVIDGDCSAEALCGTPLGAFICAGTAPGAVMQLFSNFKQHIKSGECAEVCWSASHTLSRLASVMPAVKPLETKAALVGELKLCVEGLVQKTMSVAETRSPGTGQRPCAEGKLERAIDRLLHALVAIVPPFPESLELFELGDLVNCALLDEDVGEALRNVALRLLCLLTRDLDFALHLMAHHGLKEALLHGADVTVVDESSVLRNHLTVLVLSIGGHSEKNLPPKTLSHVSDSYEWPIVTKEEGLREYFVDGVTCSTQAPEEDTIRILSGLKNLEAEPRRKEDALRTVLLSDEFRVPGPWLGELVEVVAARLPYQSEVPELIPYEDTESIVGGHREGAKLATEYGVRLGMLKEADSHELATLTNRLSETGLVRFSWLAATLYLLFEGNVNRTWSCIHRLRNGGTFRYLFDEERSVILLHNVELVLGEELPTVLGAFQVCGVSVSSVCARWLGQCFWNVLSWSGVCQWVALQLLMTENTAVYHLVSIFAHLRQRIVDSAARGDLACYATEMRIEGFEAGTFLGYITSLQEKYKDKMVDSFDRAS